MKNSSLTGKSIAFIGAGNMAEALIRGLLDTGAVGPGQILISDVAAERIAHFASAYNITQSGNPLQVATRADVAVLAVKPQQMEMVLEFLKGDLPDSCIVVSIAAGIRTGKIEHLLGGKPHVVRVMPNTPALLGCGASGMCGGRFAVEQDLSITQDIMAAVGQVCQVQELHMDAVTAVSGSGPAYAFYLVEAMMQAALELGLDEETARTLVPATVEGAARMCMESGADAAVLRQRVTSKGGTTAAALEVLESSGVKSSIVKAIRAARDRSVELSEQ